jgi:hypothetical protein
LEQLELTGKGAEFFGLSHPVVQNLIQSCPGSRRCTGYRWVKFEINKMADSVEMDSLDPTTSYNYCFLFCHFSSKKVLVQLVFISFQVNLDWYEEDR